MLKRLLNASHCLPSPFSTVIEFEAGYMGKLEAQVIKNPPAMQETWVQSLGWEDPLEKGTATYSSILAWRILWTV